MAVCSTPSPRRPAFAAKRVHYQGQAAIEFAARVDARALADGDEKAYPFAIARPDGGLPQLDPSLMWPALLRDLVAETPVAVVAARFHQGLAIAIARLVGTLCRDACGVGAPQTVALSGGVLQNCVLREQLVMRLERDGFSVLTHRGSHGQRRRLGARPGRRCGAISRCLASLIFGTSVRNHREHGGHGEEVILGSERTCK